MTARAMRLSCCEPAGAAGLNASGVSAAARQGIPSRPLQRAWEIGEASCPLPIPIKMEDADPAAAPTTASAGRHRATNDRSHQLSAAAATGASTSLDAPETPTGAQPDKVPKGPKRSSSKALGFCAERWSGIKRLKAFSGSGNRGASAAGLPSAKAPRRAEGTAIKATSPMHPRAPKNANTDTEAEEVYGDPHSLTFQLSSGQGLSALFFPTPVL